MYLRRGLTSLFVSVFIFLIASIFVAEAYAFPPPGRYLNSTGCTSGYRCPQNSQCYSGNYGSGSATEPGIYEQNGEDVMYCVSNDADSTSNPGDYCAYIASCPNSGNTGQTCGTGSYTNSSHRQRQNPSCSGYTYVQCNVGSVCDGVGAFACGKQLYYCITEVTSPPTSTPTPTRTPTPASGGSCGSGPNCGSGQVAKLYSSSFTCSSNSSCPSGYGWCYPKSSGSGGCCWACVTPTPTSSGSAPTPTPSGGSCGDGVCAVAEKCGNSQECCADCIDDWTCGGTCGGGGGGTGTGGGSCKPNGQSCTSLTNCCSGYCSNGSNIWGTCTTPPSRPACNDTCNTDADCSNATGGCTDCRVGADGRRCRTPLSTPTPTRTPTPTPLPITYQIYGYVWIDNDNDGNIDTGEQRISSAQVRATFSGGGSSYTDYTSSSGYYLIEVNNPGQYSVERLSPSGFTDINANPRSITMPNGSPGQVVSVQAAFPLVQPPTSTPTPTRTPTPTPTGIVQPPCADDIKVGCYHWFFGRVSAVNPETTTCPANYLPFYWTDLSTGGTEVNICGGPLQSRMNADGSVFACNSGGVSGEVRHTWNQDASSYPSDMKLCVVNSIDSTNKQIRARPDGECVTLFNSETESVWAASTTPYCPNPQIADVEGGGGVGGGGTAPGSGGTTDTGVMIDVGNNLCTGGTAVPYTAGLSLDLRSVSSGVVDSVTSNAAGEYTCVSDVPGDHILEASDLGNYRITAVSYDGGPFTQVGVLNGTSVGPFSLNPPSVKEVDLCLKETFSWFQTESGDVRMRNLSNPIPANRYLSSSLSNPGVVFSSESDADLGQGGASSQGSDHWVVNDEYSYNKKSEFKAGVASYSFYEFRAREVGALVEDITTLSEVDDTGVYKWNGDLVMNSFTYPGAAGEGERVVLLVDGNLTINTDIDVPNGNLFIVAVSGDIAIDSSVGGTASHTSTDIEGIFSAEGDIVLEGGGCFLGTPDQRLNVGGILIANALRPFSSAGGGSLVNQRSLCGENENFPALQVQSRFDFLLAMNDFYKTESQDWREALP